MNKILAILTIIVLIMLVSSGCKNEIQQSSEKTITENSCLFIKNEIQQSNNETITQNAEIKPREWHEMSWTLNLGVFEKKLITEEDIYSRMYVVNDSITILKIYTLLPCLVKCEQYNMTNCEYISTTCEKIYNSSDFDLKIENIDGKIFIENNDADNVKINLKGYTNYDEWRYYDEY